ncbi:hypothetical protein B0H34DRAFT_685185 [Crassisporium funariophilum]|nr:hypothetical protein B0H34DRAFT_685185 [Crassisporium funariophilum]
MVCPAKQSVAYGVAIIRAVNGCFNENARNSPTLSLAYEQPPWRALPCEISTESCATFTTNDCLSFPCHNGRPKPDFKRHKDHSLIHPIPFTFSPKVDSSGSFTANVGLQFPQCKFKPEMLLSYHSAATGVSKLGVGWALKGAPVIERVPATEKQDGFRGAVNYDQNDRFALDGLRLIRLGKTREYRFEVEQWSKVMAIGDAENPTSWKQYLPDGSTRTFGNTESSNIKALGKATATRVWAISEALDPFSNYITFEYDNQSSTTGAYYLSTVSYGGNHELAMAHQREVSFGYQTRNDASTRYLGGYKIVIDKRMQKITSSVEGAKIHEYVLFYDYSILSRVSRLRSLTLTDADGYSVHPLLFNWVDAPLTVFEETETIATLTTNSTESQVIPLDANGNGSTDIVVASKQDDTTLGKKDILFLDVYDADLKGRISDQPAPGSGSTGLPYSTQIFPLDADGNGKTDLLHISSSQDNYLLTVLLSTPEGYQRKETMNFKPSGMNGVFHTGDFFGNGAIGIVYVFIDGDGSQRKIRFIQFKSDGKRLNPQPARDGPTSSELPDLDKISVVAGDFNGNGEEDLFLIYPVGSMSAPSWVVSLIQSIDGKLTYLKVKDFNFNPGQHNAAAADDTVVLPFNADNDAKTSLLFVSKNTSRKKLQFQLLRSTGIAFLSDATSTVTNVEYAGNVAVSRITSPNALDVVNVVDGPGGPVIHVFRFNSSTFQLITQTTQPQGVPEKSLVRWADLRGIGRSDCVLNTFDNSSITVRSMQCFEFQPLDRMSGYNNGLGAMITVIYAPLSDPDTYKSDDSVVRSRVNALATNSASTASLTGSPSSTQNMECTRAELVYFPSFVVRELSTLPLPSSAKEILQFNYKNALVEFNGHGWLGFESITKGSQPLGVLETTTYCQTFPLIGQMSRLERRDITSQEILQDNTYKWASIQVNNNANHTVRLSSLKETYYEAGKRAYDVDVAFNYDAYGNVILTSIGSSQGNSSPLFIESTFSDPATFPSSLWVIGNKLTEATKCKGITLGNIKNSYLQGTRTCFETSNWVAGNVWSTKTYEFDRTGNKTDLKGPSSNHQTYQYDATHSNVITTTTFTDSNKSLVETATYDLALGLPLTITKPNGLITAFKYDVLGRNIEISQGTTPNVMSVIEQTTFRYANREITETRAISNGLVPPNSYRRIEVTYFDSFMRPLAIEKTKPDDLSQRIYVDNKYDGAGRLISRSREYLALEEPAYYCFTYDKRSRLIKETFPPAKTGGDGTTHTYAYAYEAGVPKVTEVLSDGVASRDQRILREMRIIPNANTPSSGHFVNTCVVKRTDELGQTVSTSFDDLGRPIGIVDPSGVQLTIAYDGLSREVMRRIATGGEKPKTFSHFTVKFQDDQYQTTLRNELNSQTVITKTDFCLRPKTRTTSDETLTFTYDEGSQVFKGQLVKVESSKGLSHGYGYDEYGNLSSSALNISGQNFTTFYTRTTIGELLKTVNPDGSSVTRTLLVDGSTPEVVKLLDKEHNTRASLTFSAFNNPFAQPMKCILENGITAASTVARNGMLTQTTLEKGGTQILGQTWNYDTFNKIGSYEIINGGSDKRSTSFQYDLGGQLLESSGGGTPVNFSYDNSGNLSAKGGKSFINDGWQLTTIKNPNGTIACSFDYSEDGNRTSKKNGSGIVESTMTYDSQGRLTTLDGTTFMYDYTGRLVKATAPGGDVTIYPSATYEVKISAGTVTRTAYLVEGYRRASLTAHSTSSAEIRGVSEKNIDLPQDEKSARGLELELEDKYIEKNALDGEVYYFHVDHLGSTVAVSDRTGRIITQYQYDAFGKVTITGTDVARYKYSGKELFGNMYYFGSRFYDPDTGRFLTLDNFPIDLDNVSPSCFNRYLISRNDPINYIDVNGDAPVPTWHWWVDAGLIVLGIAICIVVPLAVPALGGLLLVGLGAATGALIGAGASGLTYDYVTFRDGNTGSSNAAWGKQLLLGAVFGALTGAAGAAFDLYKPAVTLRTLLTEGVKVAPKFARRLAVRMTFDTGMGAIAGASQQVVTNWSDGVTWHTGVGESAMFGAIAGAAVSGVTGAGTQAGDYRKEILFRLRGLPRAFRELRGNRAASLVSVASRLRDSRVSLASGTKPFIGRSFGADFDWPFIDDDILTHL